jgi:hypothetical protein
MELRLGSIWHGRCNLCLNIYFVCACGLSDGVI